MRHLKRNLITQWIVLVLSMIVFAGNLLAASSTIESPLQLEYSSTIQKLMRYALGESKDYSWLTKTNIHKVHQLKAFKRKLSACNLQISPIADARENRLTIGVSRKRPIFIGDVLQWLTLAKEENFLIISKEKQPAGRVVQIDTGLTRLYTYSDGLNIYGVTAFKVNLQVDGEAKATRFYRGFGRDLNGDDSEDEHMDALNKSIDDALYKMLEGFADYCEQVSLED